MTQYAQGVGPHSSSRATTAIAVVALAQLFGTSLWFSANGAADDLIRAWGLMPSDMGWLTNAVQVGFIAGTLFIAVSGLADRFAASRIFAVSAVVGALFNALFAASGSLLVGVAVRFIVGVCLAGIYPLGMKLIVSWDPRRAGASLALLVGMLTLGTALPHGLRVVGLGLPWQQVILASSVLAVIGAAMVGWLGDGPEGARVRVRKPFRFSDFASALRSPNFRGASLGYFGHMWELYAFWTLVPLLVAAPLTTQGAGHGSVSAWSFFIIATGTLGCLLGGFFSSRFGSIRVSFVALGISGLCCLLYPLFYVSAPPVLALGLLLVWGASVIADSPQFSAVAARSCPPDSVGGTLALQNSIGIAITVVAIGLMTSVAQAMGPWVTLLLIPGPIFGLMALKPLLRTDGHLSR